jgi:type I restriction enzyme S subunit
VLENECNPVTRLADRHHLTVIESLLNELPSHWKRIQLKNALNSISSGLAIEQDKVRAGYPITRIETMTHERIDATKVGYVSGVSPATVESYRLQIGDILFSNINSEPQVGRSVVFEGHPPLLLHGMNLLRLEVNEHIVLPSMLNYIFIFYRIHGAFRSIASRAVGQASINRGRVESMKIAIPPMDEQQAIIKALRAVQQAKKAREREIELGHEHKAALMKHLFSYGTRGEITKQTEVGQMPEGWSIAALRDLGEIQSGGTPSRTKAEFYNGDITWVKTLDLNEGVVAKTEESITSQGLKSVRGKIRPIDTVMVAMYGGAGTVGKTGILGVPAATNQAVCCIMPNSERVDPFYLLYCLIGIRPTWMSQAIGTRKDPNINKGIVQKLKIPLPSIEEQHEIKSILQACDAKISILKNETKLLQEVFTTMLEEFMTGRLSSKPLIEVATA